MAHGGHGSKPEAEGSIDVIAGLRDAEESAARQLDSAASDKEARIKAAEEKARRIREKAKADAEELKGKILTEGGKRIQAEVDEIHAGSRKDIEEVRKKKVDAKAVDAAFRGVLDELDA